MVMLWYLLVLAPFIALPVLWWNFRRKQAAREQVSGARWESLAKEVVTPPTVSPVPSSVPVVPATAMSHLQAMGASYVLRDRILDPAQKVLYYLLKSGLADYEIMAQVALSSVLSVPAGITGGEREQRLRTLARETVDFVVCDKTMKPVAVIDLLAQEVPSVLTTAADFRTQCLAQSSIRYLRLVRTALPKRDELRGLVLPS